MFRGGFFRSSCLGPILKVLAWEAAIVGVAWLLYQRVSSQQSSMRFSDVLLLVGVLILFFGAFGMMRNSYDANASGTRFSFRVQPTEEEKRIQEFDSMMQQKSASVHMLAIGGLAVLLSVFSTYVLQL